MSNQKDMEDPVLSARSVASLAWVRWVQPNPSVFRLRFWNPSIFRVLNQKASDKEPIEAITYRNNIIQGIQQINFVKMTENVS